MLTPHSPAQLLDVYRRGWIVTAAISLAGAALGLALLERKRGAAVASANATAALRVACTTETP